MPMADEKGPAVGELEIGSEKYTVHANRYFQLVVEINGREIRASSKDDLIERIRKETKRQRIDHNIPVILALLDRNGQRYYTRATLRGKHARTSQVLFTMPNGDK